MKCPSCDSDQLLAVLTITKSLKLAVRGGSVKVGGEKITQVDLKDAWDKDPEGKEREIKGPILCADCGEPSFYVTGAKKNLYAGDYIEAHAVGAQFFIDGGSLGTE